MIFTLSIFQRSAGMRSHHASGVLQRWGLGIRPNKQKPSDRRGAEWRLFGLCLYKVPACDLASQNEKGSEKSLFLRDMSGESVPFCKLRKREHLTAFLTSENVSVVVDPYIGDKERV